MQEKPINVLQFRKGDIWTVRRFVENGREDIRPVLVLQDTRLIDHYKKTQGIVVAPISASPKKPLHHTCIPICIDKGINSNIIIDSVTTVSVDNFRQFNGFISDINVAKVLDVLTNSIINPVGIEDDYMDCQNDALLMLFNNFVAAELVLDTNKRVKTTDIVGRFRRFADERDNTIPIGFKTVIHLTETLPDIDLDFNGEYILGIGFKCKEEVSNIEVQIPEEQYPEPEVLVIDIPEEIKEEPEPIVEEVYNEPDFYSVPIEEEKEIHGKENIINKVFSLSNRLQADIYSELVRNTANCVSVVSITLGNLSYNKKTIIKNAMHDKYFPKIDSSDMKKLFTCANLLDRINNEDKNSSNVKQRVKTYADVRSKVGIKFKSTDDLLKQIFKQIEKVNSTPEVEPEPVVEKVTVEEVKNQVDLSVLVAPKQEVVKEEPAIKIPVNTEYSTMKKVIAKPKKKKNKEVEVEKMLRIVSLYDNKAYAKLESEYGIPRNSQSRLAKKYKIKLKEISKP